MLTVDAARPVERGAAPNRAVDHIIP